MIFNTGKCIVFADKKLEKGSTGKVQGILEMNNKIRFFYGVVGFILLIFLGVSYAWSIFVQPLEEEFGWLRSQTSITFTISMVFFCVGNLAAGRVTSKISPRTSMLITALAMGGGFIASSFTLSLPWIYISYGVACGFAMGFGANVVMSTTLRWFADCQGVASGVLLMGVGFGGIVLSPLATILLNSVGWRKTFFTLGVLLFAVLAIGAMIIQTPSEEFSGKLVEKARKNNVISLRDFKTEEMLHCSAFWLFMAWSVFIGAGSLALISNAVPAAEDILIVSMGEEESVIAATAAMGMISVFNGLGRLALGIIWDRRGYKLSLIIFSMAYGLSMAACAAATVMLNISLLVGGFILLGMTYGGSMSAASAMIGSFFGTKYYSINYACSTCSLIVAALIGPTMIGWLRTSSGSYLSSFLVILGLAFCSLVCCFFIRKPKEEK